MSKYSTGLKRAAGVVLSALTVSLVAGGAWGQTSNYIPNDFGNWTDPENWDNGVPNAVGANAVLNQPVSNADNGATTSINLNSATITLGSLTSNNDTTPTGTRYMRTQIDGGSFIFETTSGPATLNENLGASPELENRMRINVPVQLNSNLVVNSNHALNRNTNTEFVQLVSGSADKTITKEGFGNLQMAFTGALAEDQGFFGNLIINNGGVRMITGNVNATPNPNPPNTQLSKSAGVTVMAGGQFQLGNRMPSFTLGPNAELKLNGTGKVAPAATSQNDGALRFEITANSGINCTFDSPVNLQTMSHIHVNAVGTTGTLTKEVRGAGELRKTGAGMLALNFANTYAGGTTVLSGALKVDGASATLGTGNVTVNGTTDGTSLSIESGVLNAIADTAMLTLAGGGPVAGTADRNFINLGAGINEIVGGLVLGSDAMSPGTYGATGSGAGNILDEYFTGAGIVTVASSSFLAADFNNDNSVNAVDFGIWKGGFGNPTGQVKANGDANADGAVNGADFLIWQQQFGSGPGGLAAGAPVPEPAAALLALLAAPLAGRARRKRLDRQS